MKHIRYEWVRNTERPKLIDTEKLFQQALAHHKAGRLKEAERLCRQILELEPDNAEFNNYLGILNIQIGKNDIAAQCFRKVIEIDPNRPNTYYNLGITLKCLGQIEEAIDCYKEAISMKPDFAQAYNNLGNAFKILGRTTESVVCYKKAIAIKSDYSNAISNLSLYELSSYDFESGWKNHCYRYCCNNGYRKNALYMPKTTKPIYRGEILTNKILYIYREQGIGDMIMFFRFLNIFANKAKSVIFYTFEPLEGLFKSNFKRIKIVTQPYTGEYDYHMPLMDAGYVLKLDNTNIPQREGFLKSDSNLKEQYQKKYFDNDLLKIGIVWKGRPTHDNDRNRSIRLAFFLKSLNRDSRCKVYSLQKDLTQEEQELLAENDIQDIGSTFNDFADTAAAVDNLDLVISVDTAIVHLGAALGKETWVLLPKIGVDWRWGREGDKSYWYDSVTLFRQETANNWETVFSSINSVLRKKLKIK